MSISEQAAADLFRQPPERFLDVGMGEVAYRKIGTGPDVLFVHGWPVSSATFRKLLPHLTDHVTCHLIDLPGAGSSRFAPGTTLSLDNHIASVKRVIDLLELNDVAVVGHNSGGMIARHAVAGDQRVRSLVLIDTEQTPGLSMKFRSFIAGRKVPGFGSALGWLAGKPKLRRNRLVLGDAFADPSLLDGEFDEFFLRPISTSAEYRAATMRLLKSFDFDHVRALDGLHRRIEAPVLLIWGEHDRFFPVKWAKEMASTYPNTRLEVIAGAGLFSHEERPAEVAAAMLPALAARG